MVLAAVLALGVQGPIVVPFKKTEHAMIVDVAINGRQLSFMFDTGFSGAFVVDNAISLGKSTGQITLRDFVGEFQAETVPLKTVKIGEYAVKSSEMDAVMQPADYTFSYNSHCDGIMGFGAVKDSIFEINFQNSQMKFYPSSVDISQRKPDNKTTFLCKLLPIGHNSMEMEAITSGGKKLYLALDTGNSFFATTHRDVLERVGLWETGKSPKFLRASQVASGPVDSWTKKMSDMTIFGVPVPASYWDIIDLPSGSAESDGTVGFGFLKNFNVTVDYARRRVWLENYTGKFGNDPEGSTGIIAAYSPSAKKVIVVRVGPDSPAKEAGVRVGDALLSVDDKDLLGELGYREIEDLIDGEAGTKVNLVLARGSETRRLQLERRPMFND